MIITDTIQADQIEDGDQIVIDGDPIEVTSVEESEDDMDEIVVKGFSHDTGDSVQYPLPFDYYVDMWGA